MIYNARYKVTETEILGINKGLGVLTTQTTQKTQDFFSKFGFLEHRNQAFFSVFCVIAYFALYYANNVYNGEKTCTAMFQKALFFVKILRCIRILRCIEVIQ